MNLNDIEELLTLLESETPTSHSGYLRLRADALTCLLWLRQEAGDQAPAWMENRASRIFDKANEAIGRWTAKPRLCLNA